MAYYTVRSTEQSCGHRHGSESAAERCRLSKLRVGRDEAGYAAAWHGARVVYVDSRGREEVAQ